MTKLPKLSTAKEMKDVAKMLRHARNHYDNELLKIEQIWDNLNQHDYAKRAVLIETVSKMIEIGHDLSSWEQKIRD